MSWEVFLDNWIVGNGHKSGKYVKLRTTTIFSGGMYSDEAYTYTHPTNASFRDTLIFLVKSYIKI